MKFRNLCLYYETFEIMNDMFSKAVFFKTKTMSSTGVQGVLMVLISQVSNRYIQGVF